MGERQGHERSGEPGRRIARRGVLKAGLVARAVAGTGAWRAAPGKDRPLRQPGSLPYPELPAGTDTIPQIEHVVVLMMENHSYDNRLGMLFRPGADGFRIGRDGRPAAANPYPNGQIQHAFRMPTTCQLPARPSQEWTDSHTQYAGGRMDGFVTSGSGPVAMGYWQGGPALHTPLATAFPLADRWFCSVLGQTDPNRRYLIAATSAGMTDDIGNNAQSDARSRPRRRRGPSSTSSTTTASPGPTTSAPRRRDPELYFANDLHDGQEPRSLDQFFSDPRPGSLPGSASSIPTTTPSPRRTRRTSWWARRSWPRSSRAITDPQGRDTLLLTYDEHGGYYDHVPPPPASPRLGPTPGARGERL